MLLNSRAVIFGLEGTSLSGAERAFFAQVNPVGFILFKRNIETPQQVKALVAALKDLVGWECPVLIDQEGGRVARLRPPHWRESPAMGKFAALASDNLEKAARAAYLNARILGAELYDLGINVDCAPVCDLLIDGAHDIVGDRSFGGDVAIVSALARATAEGLLDSCVLPVIKHIPGHGRAHCDSHLELPVVDCSKSELQRTDFKVFSNMSDMPWAMTAHIVYTALDKHAPATQSPAVIACIRDEIGFDGLLISDDLSMQALAGDYAERTRRSLEAGCDVVLHCNGKMEEMLPIAENTGSLNPEALRRVKKSMALLKSPESLDIAELGQEYSQLVAA